MRGSGPPGWSGWPSSVMTSAASSVSVLVQTSMTKPAPVVDWRTNTYLSSGFTATGHSQRGAVNLPGARIAGQLSCSGAELHNDSGAAFEADSLEVGEGVFMRGLTATGRSGRGAVNLRGARIGGQFSCDGAELRNDSGPALQADSLQVGESVFLRGGFIAAGGGDDAAIGLAGTRVNGAFEFDPAALEHAAGPGRRLSVNGFTYLGVPALVHARGWLLLLRHGTPNYAAQPYQLPGAGRWVMSGGHVKC